MGSALHGWVGRYRLCVGPATGKATSGDVPWSATHAGLDMGCSPGMVGELVPEAGVPRAGAQLRTPPHQASVGWGSCSVWGSWQTRVCASSGLISDLGPPLGLGGPPSPGVPVCTDYFSAWGSYLSQGSSWPEGPFWPRAPFHTGLPSGLEVSLSLGLQLWLQVPCARWFFLAGGSSCMQGPMCPGVPTGPGLWLCAGVRAGPGVPVPGGPARCGAAAALVAGAGGGTGVPRPGGRPRGARRGAAAPAAGGGAGPAPRGSARHGSGLTGSRCRRRLRHHMTRPSAGDAAPGRGAPPAEPPPPREASAARAERRGSAAP